MNNQNIWIVILASFLIFGCKREDPTPELRDPIYLDIQSELRTLKQLRENVEKKIEMTQKDLEKTQPRTMERKNAISDIKKEEHKLQKIDQLITYFLVREKERLVEARRSYKKAFHDDKEWPLKSEFEAYLVNKRLVSASRNWDDRVPRSKMQQIKQNETKKAEE